MTPSSHVSTRTAQQMSAEATVKTHGYYRLRTHSLEAIERMAMGVCVAAAVLGMYPCHCSTQGLTCSMCSHGCDHYCPKVEVM